MTQEVIKLASGRVRRTSSKRAPPVDFPEGLRASWLDHRHSLPTSSKGRTGFTYLYKDKYEWLLSTREVDYQRRHV